MLTQSVCGVWQCDDVVLHNGWVVFLLSEVELHQLATLVKNKKPSWSCTLGLKTPCVSERLWAEKVSSFAQSRTHCKHGYMIFAMSFLYTHLCLQGYLIICKWCIAVVLSIVSWFTRIKSTLGSVNLHFVYSSDWVIVRCLLNLSPDWRSCNK